MLLSEFKPAYFDLSEESGVVIGRFHVPRLTEDQNVEQLGQDLFALVEQFDKRKIILSLHSVEYLTSSVLGKLITLHRKLHRKQGRLILTDLQAEVKEIMRLSRLIDYFATAETVANALHELRSQSAPEPDSATITHHGSTNKPAV
jgi:anti-sigma B factor antagonist